MQDQSVPWMRIGWGLFILVTVASVAVVLGLAPGTLFFIGAIFALLVAWRFPYGSLYALVATVPLLGWVVSIPTGSIQFGERAFGGSIDVGVGEMVALVVMTAWALRILLLWRGRRDHHWKPWLPLMGGYALIVIAHALSAFSVAAPDTLTVLKYTIRPVAWACIAFVFVPVNYIQSPRRLSGALLTLLLVGAFFSLDGLRSMVSWDDQGFQIHRAHPGNVFGFTPIGVNHNGLAEFLVVIAPFALAWTRLREDPDERVFGSFVAVICVVTALCTFARSAWIALAIQAALFAWMHGRAWLYEHRRSLMVGVACLIPLALVMVVFSRSLDVQGSTSTRLMLTDMAGMFFRDNPVFGVGAGTFVDRVAHTQAFYMQFGEAMDAHGWLQRVAAETGLLGLVALGVTIYMAGRIFLEMLRKLKFGSIEREAFMYLLIGVIGVFVYEFFSTTYWTAKLWLPIGIALAAGRIFTIKQQARDPDFLHPTTYG